MTGVDGRELLGPVEDTLRSSNFPEDLKSVFVSSDSILEGTYNYHPRNSVRLFLDFSRPDLLDFSVPPSRSTPNGSQVEVGGYDSTWVHGVFNEVNAFVRDHPLRMNWVHKNGIYDLLVWLIGLPLGFWLCYRLSASLNQLWGSQSTFLLSASYVYIVLLVLFGTRLLFGYVRWVLPLVQYQSPRNEALKHQIILGAIIVGLVSTIIWDVIKAIA